MKVQEQKNFLGRPALTLIPETLAEKALLKKCLGSGNPLRVAGVLKEFPDSADLDDRVSLWADSSNVEESLPERDSSNPGVRMIRRRADLNTFMVALKRYITTIIDLRINMVADYGSLKQYEDQIKEAETIVQEVLRPIFEEEVH